jgi:glutathione peroxidase
MFAKVDVNGDNTHPIFAFLKAGAPGVLGTEGIKWNFTKFLVDRDGKVVDRYASAHKPEDMVDDVERLL